MSNLLCFYVEASSGPEPEPGPLQPHHSSGLDILSYVTWVRSFDCNFVNVIGSLPASSSSELCEGRLMMQR
jgi:hypothetical protein